MRLVKTICLLTGIGILLPVIISAQSTQMGQEEIRYNMGPIQVERICKEYSKSTGQCMTWETIRTQPVLSKSICQKRDHNKNCLWWVTIPAE